MTASTRKSTVSSGDRRPHSKGLAGWPGVRNRGNRAHGVVGRADIHCVAGSDALQRTTRVDWIRWSICGFAGHRVWRPRFEVRERREAVIGLVLSALSGLAWVLILTMAPWPE